MRSQIVDKIKNCPACLTYSNTIQKEEIIQKPIPTRPWECVSADFFHFRKEEYLLVVDEFTKFPEVVCLQHNTTASRVITEFKSIFARHGKPVRLFTDNGPQFTNVEFQKFLKQWEIQHQTSTPHYPQSNGFIERHVQTIKKMLLKTLFDGKDIYLTLLEYRNTPINKHVRSPAQLLFGRRLKGEIPIKEKLLIPEFDTTSMKNFLKVGKEREKSYYNRNCKNLKQLSVGDDVIVQNSISKKWEPAKIVKIDVNRPRSYFVKFQNGNVLYSVKWQNAISRLYPDLVHH